LPNIQLFNRYTVVRKVTINAINKSEYDGDAWKQSINWRAFLGEDDLSTSSAVGVYDDEMKKNRVEHSKECNSEPWSAVRRIVPYSLRSNVTINWNKLSTDGSVPVAVSLQALLSENECKSLILEAESTDKWTKRFPFATKEQEDSMPDRVLVDDLPNSLVWLTSILASRIAPALEQVFDCHAHQFCIYQAVVLRYRSSHSTSVHQDFSYATLTIPLNSNSDYLGGGTWMDELGDAVKLQVGYGLTHGGRAWHGGASVEGGCRYALALFFHTQAGTNDAKRFEQQALAFISADNLQDAIHMLHHSLRAYEAEWTDSTSSHLDTLGVLLDGQGLWGLLAILQLRSGQIEESARSEAKFIVHIAHLRGYVYPTRDDVAVVSSSHRQHPALAGALQNLEVLMQLKEKRYN
jgi:hypothetical protein